MAIVAFRELNEGRKLNERIEDRIVVKDYERKFLVLSDDKTDTPQTVRDYGGAPTFGTAHPDNPLARVVRPVITPALGEDAPKAWHARYVYSTKWPEVESDDNPLNHPARWSWTTREVQVPLTRDAVTGDMISNTAGDPPDPPQTTRRGFRVLTVRKNVAGVPSWLLNSSFCTNDAAFTLVGESIDAKQALITIVDQGELNRLNGYAFYPLTIQVEIAREDHLLRLLNDGFNQLEGGDASDKRPILINGEPTQIPVPLAADGSQIPAASLPGAALFREWNEFPAISFTPIGLPV